MTVGARIQIRRDTAANWTSANPVLLVGEPGLETNTGRQKIGDGVTAWNALAYAAQAPLADGGVWATGTAYTGGQTLDGPDGLRYECATGHTSGVFATDLAAGKWVRTSASTVGLSGPAGGRLAGSYPNPTLAPASIVDADVAAGAAIAPTKLALVNDGAFTSPTQRTAAFMTHKRRKTGNNYFGPLGSRSSVASLVIAGGLCYFMPIHVERPLTLSTVSFQWVTAPTGGHVRLGVWADDGQASPTGNPLADSGAQVASTTNASTQAFAALGLALTPGLYHLGLLFENDLTGASPSVAPYAPSLDLPTWYQAGLTTSLPAPVGTLVQSSSGTWPWPAYAVSAFT